MWLFAISSRVLLRDLVARSVPANLPLVATRLVQISMVSIADWACLVLFRRMMFRTRYVQTRLLARMLEWELHQRMHASTLVKERIRSKPNSCPQCCREKLFESWRLTKPRSWRTLPRLSVLWPLKSLYSTTISQNLLTIITIRIEIRIKKEIIKRKCRS